MSLFKKIMLVLVSLVCTICLGLDIWYGVILATGKEKIISQTFILGEQTVSRIDENGNSISENEPFCEVNIFDDVYEIKLNYLLDENKEYFYSQGLQFIANDGSDTIDFDSKTFSKVVKNERTNSKLNFKLSTFFVRNSEFNRLLTDVNYENLTIKNYGHDTISDTNYTSISPITSKDYFFKLDIDGKTYGMKFKNEDIKFDEKSHLFVGTTSDMPTMAGVYTEYAIYKEYRTADVYFFAEEIYKSIIESDVKLGETLGSYTELPNIFNFYEYKDGQYSETTIDLDKATKLTEDIKTYCGIKINRHEGKMTNASQSLFNMKDGNANFALEGSIPTNYFTGTTLLSVTVNDFDWVSTENANEYKFKLSNDFKKIYGSDNSKKLKLYVNIDLDILNDYGITFAGFEENAFENFSIYKAVTSQNGIITEVEYA